MSGKYALIWRLLDCCWDNKEDTQNFSVSYASRIGGAGTNFGMLYIDQKGSNCNQDPKIFVCGIMALKFPDTFTPMFYKQYLYQFYSEFQMVYLVIFFLSKR
jgi:hypothetical protein